jgi:hypothetical protein
MCTIEGASLVSESQIDPARHVGNLVLQLGRRLAVDDTHGVAGSDQMGCQRDPAARGAHYKRRHVASRATPAAASAETSPAAQKLSAMRFSVQPWWWNV